MWRPDGGRRGRWAHALPALQLLDADERELGTGVVVAVRGRNRRCRGLVDSDLACQLKVPLRPARVSRAAG